MSNNVPTMAAIFEAIDLVMLDDETQPLPKALALARKLDTNDDSDDDFDEILIKVRCALRWARHVYQPGTVPDAHYDFIDVVKVLAAEDGVTFKLTDSFKLIRVFKPLYERGLTPGQAWALGRYDLGAP